MPLYSWSTAGLADEARSDAMPEVAGGEVGHGAAKPHTVIHRFMGLSLRMVNHLSRRV